MSHRALDTLLFKTKVDGSITRQNKNHDNIKYSIVKIVIVLSY